MELDIQHFERRNPALNMKRFYRLTVERDLFGATLLVRQWGRIGTLGRRREEEMPDRTSAEHAADGLARRKRRRGYAAVE